jgi:acyl carrier protein
MIVPIMHEADTIRDRIRAYVADNFLMGASRDALQDDASFMAHGLLDSTGVLELVSFLEEQFGFEIANEEVVPENLDSLRAIEAFVQRKLAAQAA